MTEDIKKLIESVKVYKGAFSTYESGHCVIHDAVSKSDFDRVVEELTKWNKVEDCLPDTGKQLIVKFRDNSIDAAWYLSHKYRDCMFYARCEPDIDFILEDIFEWKYIN